MTDLEAIIETGSVAAMEIAASALAARGQPTTACVNCASPLLGAYCAVCGQPSVTGRRSVHHLLYAFVKDVVNFDSRVLRTARALLLEPGELPAAFRRGQTQPYVPAIRLYLFVTLIFFLLLGITHIAILQVEVTAKPVKVTWVNGNAFIPNPAYEHLDGQAKLDVDEDPDLKQYSGPLIPISREKALRPGGVFDYGTNIHYFARIGAYHPSLSPAARDRLMLGAMTDTKDPNSQKVLTWFRSGINGFIARIAADPAALNEPLTTWIPRALFLLLPLYALLLALFHIRRRKDYYLVDHLVFSFSIHTFVFVALMIAVALAQLVAGEIVAWILFCAISLYIFLAMKRFYAQGWIRTTVKFVLVSGIYTLFFLFPALLAILALSIFGVDFG